MNTRIERLTGIPAGRVQGIVALYKADPDYISHKVIPEDAGGTTFTIEVTLRA